MSLPAFAALHGHLLEPMPEHLAGEAGERMIPLHGPPGSHLWDGGRSLGVYLLGSRRALKKLEAAVRILPGWKEQTWAEDALLGWFPWDAWTDAHAAVLFPKRAVPALKPRAARLPRGPARTPQEIALASE